MNGEQLEPKPRQQLAAYELSPLEQRLTAQDQHFDQLRAEVDEMWGAHVKAQEKAAAAREAAREAAKQNAEEVDVSQYDTGGYPVMEAAEIESGTLMFRDVTVNLISIGGSCIRFLKDPEAMAEEEPGYVDTETERFANCLESLNTYLGVMRTHPDILKKELTPEGAFPGLRAEADEMAKQGGAAIDHYVRTLASRVAEQDKGDAREKVRELAS